MQPDPHLLPRGAHLGLPAMRSDGILTPDARKNLARNGIPMAFDPRQCGWVPASVIDDLSPGTPTAPTLTSVRRTDGAELHLRPWSHADLTRFVALLDDPAVWTHLPERYPDPLTPDLARDLIDIANSSNHHRVFAVLREGAPVGQVRLLFDVEPKNPGVAEISYWFGRDYWGQGLASRTVAAFATRMLSENPALTALIARVRPENGASRRVLEKCGFAEDPERSSADWTILLRSR